MQFLQSVLLKKENDTSHLHTKFGAAAYIINNIYKIANLSCVYVDHPLYY